MPHLPDHQTDHDPLLIAAFASGDAEGADLERARDLVARCDECAALHHDLRALAAAMPALPAPVRGRDFRLTPEQAASLRPAGWRRLLAPLAGPRFAFAAPLGGSLAALGIAGILVAGAAGMPLAGVGNAVRDGSTPATAPAAANDPDLSSVELGGEAPASAQPELRPAPSMAAPAAGQGDAQYGAAASSPPHDTAVASQGPEGQPVRSSTDGEIKAAASDPGTGTSSNGGESEPRAAANPPALLVSSTDGPAPLPVLATVVLVAGALLVGIRFVARRAA